MRFMANEFTSTSHVDHVLARLPLLKRLISVLAGHEYVQDRFPRLPLTTPNYAKHVLRSKLQQELSCPQPHESETLEENTRCSTGPLALFAGTRDIRQMTRM